MGISPVAVNFKSQSAACSENDLIIEPGACVSGNTAPGCAEISDGVMNLDLDMDLSPGVDYNAVQTAAFAKLNALGLRDAATADYVMFLFPPGISPYIAYAYINWWASFYSDTWGGSVSAHMHEVGHNFGLAHSGELGEEYGDQSTYMGYSYSSIGSPAMCYHGGQHRSLGWYSTHTTEIAASDFVSGQNELVDLFASHRRPGPVCRGRRHHQIGRRQCGLCALPTVQQGGGPQQRRGRVRKPRHRRPGRAQHPGVPAVVEGGVAR